MDHHDIILSHYHTAQMTAANNQRQHLNRQLHAHGDAESRAFYAERGQQQANQALAQEQQEHAVTRAAMTRLLAENIAYMKLVRHLAERWAGHENKTADELRQAWLNDAKTRADSIEATPGNDVLLRRDMEVLRDAARLFPKQLR